MTEHESGEFAVASKILEGELSLLRIIAHLTPTGAMSDALENECAAEFEDLCDCQALENAVDEIADRVEDLRGAE